MTTMDRRGFLARGAALSGSALFANSLLSTFDSAARRTRRRGPATTAAAVHRRLRPVAAVAGGQRSGRVRLLRVAGRIQLRGVRQDRYPAGQRPVGAQPQTTTAWPLTGPGQTVRLTRNQEDRDAPGPGPCKVRRTPGTTRCRRRCHRSGLRPAHPPAGSRLHRCQRHPRQLRRRHRLPPPGGSPARRRSPARRTVRAKHGYVSSPRGRHRHRGGRAADRDGPLLARGRRPDQHTGIVYLTEDAGSDRGSGFYRFLPKTRPGFAAGVGCRCSVSAADRRSTCVRARPATAGCRSPGSTSTTPTPTRSWKPSTRARPACSRRAGPPAGRSSTGWRASGRQTGGSSSRPPAAATPRTATSTPTARRRLRPDLGVRPGRRHDDGGLRLVFESPGGSVLDSPDNLTITPQGQSPLCEDDAGSVDGDTHPLAPGLDDVNRLIGLTGPAGRSSSWSTASAPANSPARASARTAEPFS